MLIYINAKSARKIAKINSSHLKETLKEINKEIKQKAKQGHFSTIWINVENNLDQIKSHFENEGFSVDSMQIGKNNFIHISW